MAKASIRNDAKELPENHLHPADAAEWRRWLEKHHTRKQGIWLVTYKKGTGLSDLDYPRSVEEALCFGWIDSKPLKLNDNRRALWFAPRKPRTGWSRANKERVGRLIAEGRMAPPGLAKVEAAKKDGSWEKLDHAEAMVIPDDLRSALDGYPNAARHFDAFPPSTRKAILEWIGNAKRPETRARRVEETARLAEENMRANQWRPADA